MPDRERGRSATVGIIQFTPGFGEIGRNLLTVERRITVLEANLIIPPGLYTIRVIRE